MCLAGVKRTLTARHPPLDPWAENRLAAFAKPASAAEGRPEKIMLKQNFQTMIRFN
jgi:hypothetical protein